MTTWQGQGERIILYPNLLMTKPTGDLGTRLGKGKCQITGGVRPNGCGSPPTGPPFLSETDLCVSQLEMVVIFKHLKSHSESRRKNIENFDN